MKGQPYNVTLSLSQATSVPLTIVLAYGGNAAQGTDFTLPGGNLVVPPGQTSLPVVIPTVVDKTVESDRVLIVAVASSSAYQIGSPNTAQVTIESQVMPELTITASTAARVRRRRGDVHDPRRPGAGRRTRRSTTRSSAPRSRARTSSRCSAPRSCRAGQTR